MGPGSRSCGAEGGAEPRRHPDLVAGMAGQHVAQQNVTLRIRGEPQHDLLQVGPVGLTIPVRDVGGVPVG